MVNPSINWVDAIQRVGNTVIFDRISTKLNNMRNGLILTDFPVSATKSCG